jgi:hypothetical protein
MEALLQTKGSKKEAKIKRETFSAEATETIVEEATLNSRGTSGSGPTGAFLGRGRKLQAGWLYVTRCPTKIQLTIHRSRYHRTLRHV